MVCGLEHITREPRGAVIFTFCTQNLLSERASTVAVFTLTTDTSRNIAVHNFYDPVYNPNSPFTVEIP